MNEFNNSMQNNESQTPITEQNAHAQTQEASAVQNEEAQNGENLYARTDGNQNAAFAQSADFHREAPYQNTQETTTGETPVQNANPNPYGPGFNPYTGQPYGQSAPESRRKRAKKEKKAGRGGGVVKKVAATVALALVFGLVSGGVILGMTGGRGIGGNQDGGHVNPGNGILSAPNAGGELRSASAIMEEALKAAEIATADALTIPQINIIMTPSMVAINCITEVTYNSIFGSQVYQTQSAGSGIIVGENETELLIVTNNHVVDAADEISVTFADDSEYTAYVKGTDAQNDLAIIVVKREDVTEESMNAIAYAELGDSDALVVGEDVVAIGNALGFGQSVTSGIVSALNRAVTDENGNTTYLIQTDTAINPGNSGGALVNRRGQVIGINSAKYSDKAVEGMCFAIPINTALPILEELMTRTTRVEVADPEKRAYLGISPNDVDSQMAAAYNMPVGVYVSEVIAGGAAEKAGMFGGDIITRFDKETITNTASLQKTLAYYEAGETVEIVVQRYERGQYVETTLTVTLDAKPAEEAVQPPTEEAAPSWKDFFG